MRLVGLKVHLQILIVTCWYAFHGAQETRETTN